MRLYANNRATLPKTDHLIHVADENFIGVYFTYSLNARRIGWNAVTVPHRRCDYGGTG